MMNKTVIAFRSSLVAAALVAAGASSGSFSPAAYAQNVCHGHTSYAPKGLVIPVTLSNSISAAEAQPGDMIQAIIDSSVDLGHGSIPAGSVVTGTVTHAQSGGIVGPYGHLGVQFTSMKTPDGCFTHLNAHIVGGLGKYAAPVRDQKTSAGQQVHIQLDSPLALASSAFSSI